MGFYIFLKMDPSNQRFAEPPEKLTPIAEFKHEALIHDVAFSPVDASVVAGTVRLSMMDLHGNIVWREFDLKEESEKPPDTP